MFLCSLRGSHVDPYFHILRMFGKCNMHILRVLMAFTCTCTLYALVYQTLTLLPLHVMNKMVCMNECHASMDLSKYLDSVTFVSR